MMRKKLLPEYLRLQSLRAHRILDTAPEEQYDALVRQAAEICGVPYAAISLLDENRQWFKAHVGLGVSETPRDISFCTHTIQHAEPMQIVDATKDTRFVDNPLVENDPKIRFYYGVPLITGDGAALGALCVVDIIPRHLEPSQAVALQAIADEVVNLIESSIASKSVRQQIDNLETIVENIPMALARVDEAGRIHWTNTEWHTLFAQTAESALGHNLAECLGGPGSSQAELNRILNEKSPAWREVALIRNGNGLTVRWSHSLIEDGYRLIMARDISETKSRDAIIEAQKQKILQSARLAALGEMGATIAHEINNPLAVISGLAQLLSFQGDAGKLEPAKVAAQARQIEDMVKRMSRIVNSLKTFARDGEMDPIRNNSFNQICLEGLAICRMRCQRAGIDLQVDIPAQEVMVECREVQIPQVIVNLVNNAIDAVQARPDPWIRFQLEDLGETITFSVTDCGLGIPPDIREKIMQPFFTTKPPRVGTGLGLSLSRRIVDQHQGHFTLDVSSAHTRFVVSLPKKQARAA